jgi:uncharacterized delta-60 repeat protein
MKHFTKIFCTLLSAMTLFSCREKVAVFEDPYAGGKLPLGVRFEDAPPSPAQAFPGATISFQISGLLKFKDKMVFTFNREKATVVSLDDKELKVKVPELASSGIVAIQIDDQVFYGPEFRVRGKLEFDPTYKALIGSNGTILEQLELANSRKVIVGGFTDFESKGIVKPINRIVLTSKDGEVDRSFLAGKAANGSISSIVQLNNGKFVIGGAFGGFDTHTTGGNKAIFSMTQLNSNGSLDTTEISTFLKKDTVPTFNGGTDQPVSKLLISNNRVTALGNFRYYLKKRYDVPTQDMKRDSLVIDSIEMRQIARFYANGALDTSFNFDFQTRKSYAGPNGYITDAYMQNDGKIIIVGKFTKYNNNDANNIVRINQDGSMDPSFNVGSGVDGYINTIRYNSTTQKFVIAGSFTKVNGQSRKGIALLNANGSLDASFVPRDASNGFVSFACQLSNGLIAVAGSFDRYDNIARGGFMILNSTGGLAKDYNATGKLANGDFSTGFVKDIVETRSSANEITLTVYGAFNKFDGTVVGNIMRLILKP